MVAVVLEKKWKMEKRPVLFVGGCGACGAGRKELPPQCGHDTRCIVVAMPTSEGLSMYEPEQGRGGGDRTTSMSVCFAVQDEHVRALARAREDATLGTGGNSSTAPTQR